MQLTKPMLRAVYAMLRVLPPFNRWRLPEAREIKFEILSRRYRHLADYEFNAEQHVIRITRRADTLPLLIESMAHEMAHVHQDRHGPARMDPKDPNPGHGPDFQLIADKVCRHLGFRRKGF